MHAADLANVNLMNTLHMTQMAALRAWWRPHYLQLAVPHLRDDLLRDITLSIDANHAQVVGGDRGDNDTPLRSQQRYQSCQAIWRARCANMHPVILPLHKRALNGCMNVFLGRHAKALWQRQIEQVCEYK